MMPCRKALEMSAVESVHFLCCDGAHNALGRACARRCKCVEVVGVSVFEAANGEAAANVPFCGAVSLFFDLPFADPFAVDDVTASVTWDTFHAFVVLPCLEFFEVGSGNVSCM